MIIQTPEVVTINNLSVREAQGNCNNYNIVYMIYCKLCSKAYVGRTTRALKIRIGEHRRKFLDLIKKNKNKNNTEVDDSNHIGLHLISDHDIRNENSFETSLCVLILENTSPMNLEIKEHKYIQMYRTLCPMCLNTNNPFKIPILPH